jgi:hypothetical protein
MSVCSDVAAPCSLLLPSTVEVRLVPHVAFNSHANSMFQPNIPANRDQVLFCLYTHSLMLILPLLTQISHYPQNFYFTSYIPPTRRVQLKSSAISDYAGDWAGSSLGTCSSTSWGGRALPIRLCVAPGWFVGRNLDFSWGSYHGLFYIHIIIVCLATPSFYVTFSLFFVPPPHSIHFAEYFCENPPLLHQDWAEFLIWLSLLILLHLEAFFII